MGFNSRSRMGSDRAKRPPPALHGCFNSRSRMGSDIAGTTTGIALVVSIHAPAWGATRVRTLGVDLFVVSIHAPAWGATRKSLGLEEFCLFQFTLPHGERPSALHAYLVAEEVSIHAPAWGATSRPAGPRPSRCFNSRSRMGSDLRPRRGPKGPASFNSRSRMGSDQNPFSIARRPWGFNSRSRMGSDPPPSTASNTVQSFNSRSRMGSDPRLAQHSERVRVSIHAPAWGATGLRRWGRRC